MLKYPFIHLYSTKNKTYNWKYICKCMPNTKQLQNVVNFIDILINKCLIEASLDTLFFFCKSSYIIIWDFSRKKKLQIKATWLSGTDFQLVYCFIS